MCPLWPFHHILLYLFLFCALWLSMCVVSVHAVDKINATFDPEELLINLHDTETIHFNATDCSIFNKNHLQVATIDTDKILEIPNANVVYDGKCTGSFNVTGKYLGIASLYVRNDIDSLETSNVTVKVIKKNGVIDSVFAYSVAILVSVIYINFGCALDWEVVKKTIKRPIGPAIGFTCQFLLMPLISFGVGQLVFPDSPPMQLGLFFTGLSPAGGASNIWSVALDANVNLSITMTTLSTIGAFAMFPVWLFTLGQYIFAAADTATPYEKISTYVISLVVPLAVGLLCQRYLPRFSKFMTRILKPFSALLIIFIIVFACIAKQYVFSLFTWKVVVAGMLVPWLGYLGGFLAAMAFRQPMKDVWAIAVETGVQNTGIAFFMLEFVLKKPESDITSVIPVAVSVMTPIPLTILLIALRIYRRNQARRPKMELLKGEGAELPDNKEIVENGNYIQH